MSTHGIDPKGDAGAAKTPLHLIPSFPMHEAAWVLKLGADKYGPYNWRENRVLASTYRAAMQRHLDQWFDGLEDVDSESGRSHLAHVISSAIIVLDAMKHGTLEDDRPSRGVADLEARRSTFDRLMALSPEMTDEGRSKVRQALGELTPYTEEQMATAMPGRLTVWTPDTKILVAGKAVSVPELPEGFDLFEVLPPTHGPTKIGLMSFFWYKDGSPCGGWSDDWAVYDLGPGKTNYHWVVAHKAEVDPFAGLPDLPPAPAGKKWERIPEEEYAVNHFESGTMWCHSSTGPGSVREWRHNTSTTLTPYLDIVYIRPVPTTNC